MGQRSNKKDAAVKDAQINPLKEECALGMVQRSNVSYAALKDAQINPNGEEYAGDTVHSATPLMNLQLSHRALDQILIRLL